MYISLLLREPQRVCWDDNFWLLHVQISRDVKHQSNINSFITQDNTTTLKIGLFFNSISKHLLIFLFSVSFPLLVVLDIRAGSKIQSYYTYVQYHIV